MPKSLQIFKPGRHTTMDGRVIEFTVDEVRAIAASYDPQKFEAPFVVGHPSADAPAYGWAHALSFSDGILHAEPHQVEPQFAEMVNAGRFKKISSSLYPKDHPKNPSPGNYYLRHIGFLGANPPAIQGLKSASFAEDEGGMLEFSDWGDSIVANLFRAVRDFIIDKFSKEEADRVLPDYSITALTERAVQPAPTASLSYTERKEETSMDPKAQEIADREAKLKVDEDKLQKQRTEFAERDKAQKDAAAALRRTAIAARIGAVVKAGKLLPVHAAPAIAFAASLDEAATIEFSEGDKKATKPAADWFLEFVEAQPQQVPLGTVGDKAALATGDDADPKALADAALKFQESERALGREVSLSVAMTHITKQSAQR